MKASIFFVLFLDIVCHHLNVGGSFVVNGRKPTIHFNEPVTLVCKEGFNGSSMQISCNHDGTWPDKRPTCTRKYLRKKQITYNIIVTYVHLYFSKRNFRCMEVFKIKRMVMLVFL